ncbi:mitochondrial outer membrane import complex protein METAXIN [Andrographis paniculata]|uniref:mitochondrial outer membrane import complex protein METAXIN n=1 Tax=Andrographis paniculata TaxID=175694 RepID=UPI0021E88C18|nr:mitochondrial outer membrane import complex protein METAXIN [Andrographis paniculata]
MEGGREEREKLTLVARKSCFGLPTACPHCLPVYIYLRFSKIPFNLEFNLIHPDSDQIPYIEFGDYVAYNNEKGGVINSMKEEGIVDLDSGISDRPEWISMKALVESWLAEALMYELWVAPDNKPAHKIYYSDLPWPIGKILYFKQVLVVKKQLGITASNAERREEEIYSKAALAYDALSSRLGEESFFFDNRPTSLDAVFLGQVLLTLHALPETSILRSKLLDHPKLVNYADNLKAQYIDVNPSSSSVPPSDPSSSASWQGRSNYRSKPRSKPTREKTEEQKKFRRRAKYFLAAQLIAVLVFLSLVNGSNDAEVDLGDEDDESLS